jgi:hypothetical protein
MQYSWRHSRDASLDPDQAILQRSSCQIVLRGRDTARASSEPDHAMEATGNPYHLFELGSAASQLAIVLASAAIITGLTFLVYLAGGLGIVGAGLGVIALLAPTMLHPLARSHFGSDVCGASNTPTATHRAQPRPITGEQQSYGDRGELPITGQ